MSRKSLFKGILILGASGMLAKILGFFFRIPLIYLIGDEGFGLYQLTYPLYGFILAIAGGIPIAISKMISERIALNKRREARKIFKTALWVMAIFGGAASLGLYIFADSIINTFKWGENAYYTLMGISLAPLFTCVLSAFRGYFQGLEEMAPSGASQVIEQAGRIVVGVGLAYLLFSQGIPRAAGGASFGAAAGAAIALLCMIYWYRRSRIQCSNEEKSSRWPVLLIEILKIAIPISLAQAIGSIMSLIDSLLVPSMLKSAGFTEYTVHVLYGQLTGKAHVLVNVPMTLSMALSQSIVPAISSAYAVKDFFRFNKNVQQAFKIAAILTFPSCAGLIVLAHPILSLVFLGKGEGWELLQILGVATIFIIAAQTASSVMNGINKMVLPVIAMAIGAGFKIIMNMVLIPIPGLNIKGAAYATVAAYALIAVIDIIFVIRTTKVYINIQETVIMPAICTVVMIFTVILVYERLIMASIRSSLVTLIAILVGGVVYLLMLMMTGTLSLKEMRGYMKR